MKKVRLLLSTIHQLPRFILKSTLSLFSMKALESEILLHKLNKVHLSKITTTLIKKTHVHSLIIANEIDSNLLRELISAIPGSRLGKLLIKQKVRHPFSPWAIWEMLSSNALSTIASKVPITIYAINPKNAVHLYLKALIQPSDLVVINTTCPKGDHLLYKHHELIDMYLSSKDDVDAKRPLYEFLPFSTNEELLIRLQDYLRIKGSRENPLVPLYIAIDTVDSNKYLSCFADNTEVGLVLDKSKKINFTGKTAQEIHTSLLKNSKAIFIRNIDLQLRPQLYEEKRIAMILERLFQQGRRVEFIYV